MGSQRVGHDLVTEQQHRVHFNICKDGNLTLSVLTTKIKNKAKGTQGSFQG